MNDLFLCFKVYMIYIILVWNIGYRNIDIYWLRGCNYGLIIVKEFVGWFVY